MTIGKVNLIRVFLLVFLVPSLKIFGLLPNTVLETDFFSKPKSFELISKSIESFLSQKEKKESSKSVSAKRLLKSDFPVEDLRIFLDKYFPERLLEGDKLKKLGQNLQVVAKKLGVQKKKFTKYNDMLELVADKFRSLSKHSEARNYSFEKIRKEMGWPDVSIKSKKNTKNKKFERLSEAMQEVIGKVLYTFLKVRVLIDKKALKEGTLWRLSAGKGDLIVSDFEKLSEKNS